MNKTHLTFLTDWEGNDYEFELTEEDARLGCHQGNCDDDCAMLQTIPYIKEQLKRFSVKAMKGICMEYGLDGAERYNRDELEQSIIWLAAGNINEDVCGEMFVAV